MNIQERGFGQRLRYERDRLHLSQEQLAEKIGGSVPSIQRWENDRVVPRADMIKELCQVFGKSVDVWGMAARKKLVWNIPFLRNQYFTGREAIFTRLHKALTGENTVALTQTRAISGLGGIGKTQTALEYAYRYAEEYEAVLWVHADSHELLLSEFASLATVLNLPEKDQADQSRVVTAVKWWLREHSPWLLVVDNADDIAMVLEFLPSRGGGATLLTTRSQVTGQHIKKIELEKMSHEEGISFLLHRAGLLEEEPSSNEDPEQERQAAELIYQLMDGLPLALDQAAAYVEENQCGLRDYLSLYQTRRAALLQWRGSLSHKEYPASVATTWSLAFRKLEERTPAAVDVLRLCAFLHPDAIPEEIFMEGAAHLGSLLQTATTNTLVWNSTLQALLSYSLIRRHPQEHLLSMHRLVQAVIKDAMDKESQLKWAEQTVRLVNRAFPEVELATWPKCQHYLPHAQVCAELIDQWDMRSSQAIQLLSKTGNYLGERAQYSEAEILLKKALLLREQLLGLEDLDMAADMNNLARFYVQMGKYTEAEILYQRAQAIRERLLGHTHPEVATIIDNLGWLYREQGQLAQAESLKEHALAIRTQVLGPEHLDVAESLQSLAVVYSDLGKYGKAEPILLQALTIYEKFLGIDHPEVATTLNNLGWNYYRQGRYELAEAMLLRALMAYEKGLGPNHPDTTYSLEGLAMLYRDQGKYVQAEPFSQRALMIREQWLGPEHREVAQSLRSLGRLYYLQKKYALAESLLKRSISIEERLGGDYPFMSYGLNSLALLYCDQGRYAEAEPLFQRALTICEQAFGKDNIDVSYTLADLAVLYHKQGRYDEAETLFQRALGIQEQILEPEHPKIAQCLNDLALLYYDQTRYSQAEPLFQRALTIQEQMLGKEHPAIESTLANYAALLRKTDREAQAIVLEERAMAIRAKHNLT